MDDMREKLSDPGIHYVDVGGGGIWGLREGYCLMVGGEKVIFHHLSRFCGHCPAGRIYVPRRMRSTCQDGITTDGTCLYGEGFSILKHPLTAATHLAVAHSEQGSVVRPA
jgi:6-phosphogluconate dehydrogenase